jgi:hypothetical protein
LAGAISPIRRLPYCSFYTNARTTGAHSLGARRGEASVRHNRGRLIAIPTHDDKG